jgi:allophanate hydrolase subunit 2
MSFQPIDSLNTQILNELSGVVADATEKQNAADAIENYIAANGGFLKEVLNDSLSTDIKDNYDGSAIVSVGEANEVTVAEASPAGAYLAQQKIKKDKVKASIEQAVTDADTQNILGESYEDFVNNLNP